VAVSFLSRLVGLLRSPGLDPGEALIIPGCNSIHTYGMRFPIDAVFVNRRWEVLALRAGMPPGRVSPLVWRASRVIELPAGTIDRCALQVGDQLALQTSD
jgi:uncharacterized membrane protein (UPF0127 family)